MKPAKKVKHKNHLYNIVLRVDGQTKNNLIDAATKHNMPLSQYIIYCAWEHARTSQGIPKPGNAQYTVADTTTILQAYLRGETILMPCGQTKCDMTTTEIAGFQFCTTCNVRVR